MALFTPLTNYAGYEHVLNAMLCFVHQNGNAYGIAIEKRGGITQDLSVYRVRPGSLNREHVHTYVGGVDVQSQIAAGGCQILQDGSLWVWAAADPLGGQPITKTGFVGGFFDPIPGIDDPWSAGGAQGPVGPIGPPGPAGAGGITLFDVPLSAPAWTARQFSGGVLVDIPAVFGAPVASVYLLRLAAQASAPNVTLRAGSQAAPYIATVTTQAAGVRIDNQGAAPGPSCYVSVVGGVATCWVQVIGWA